MVFLICAANRRSVVPLDSHRRLSGEGGSSAASVGEPPRTGGTRASHPWTREGHSCTPTQHRRGICPIGHAASSFPQSGLQRSIESLYQSIAGWMCFLTPRSAHTSVMRCESRLVPRSGSQARRTSLIAFWSGIARPLRQEVLKHHYITVANPRLW